MCVVVLCLIMCCCWLGAGGFFFFFNDTATTEIYTLSLHDAPPISLFKGFPHMGIGIHIISGHKSFPQFLWDILLHKFIVFSQTEMKSLFDTNQPGNHAKQFFSYYIIHMVNSKKNFFAA